MAYEKPPGVMVGSPEGRRLKIRTWREKEERGADREGV